MQTRKKSVLFISASLMWVLATSLAATKVLAADYVIDTRGAHASIHFKIPHLGYSYLLGRFDEFSGQFSYDPNDPAAAKASVVIKTASLNSNHKQRDDHLRGSDFLDVEKFPEATFESTKFTSSDGKNGKLEGNLTLHGVTKPVTIEVQSVGEGKDPWGGYRAGFSGTTTLTLKDFGINFDLGAASSKVELELQVEGVRQ